MRNAVVLFIALVLVLAGCDNRTEQVEKQNQELMHELASRDQFIDEMTNTINDVHTKLEKARAIESNIMQRTTTVEENKKMTQVEVRQSILHQIADFDSFLSENRAKINDIESKLRSSRKQYAGLQKMVATLKRSLEEREKTVAQLESRVQNLESVVSEKTRVIAANETTISGQQSVIKNQSVQLSTAYYVVGKRNDLEGKGIIKDEGGFPWGWIGSTTVLSSGFDNAYFKPIDKSREMTIEVPGRIYEIIPRRNAQFYVKEEKENNLTVLKIVRPDYFWQEDHLVIVTD